MEKTKRLVWAASLGLVGLGLAALALNFVPGWNVNFSWPIVVILLSIGLVLLANALAEKWARAVWLYAPAGLLLALGLIFLLNILTSDWNAWAYAWMLAVAGLGAGLALANQRSPWHPLITWVGAGLAIAGVTFGVLFGALVGGRFIQVMAPILLVLGGLGLRWLLLETPLLERWLRRAKPAVSAVPVVSAVQAAAPAGPAAAAGASALVEPLSARELEVLRLIEQGLSNAEIADRLILAPSTVKTHINNIYGKLGVQTRVQALIRARELGLLDAAA